MSYEKGEQESTRLSRSVFFYEQLKNCKHVKFAGLFARGRAFLFFNKKKTEKKLARVWFNHLTHSFK